MADYRRPPSGRRPPDRYNERSSRSDDERRYDERHDRYRSDFRPRASDFERYDRARRPERNGRPGRAENHRPSREDDRNPPPRYSNNQPPPRRRKPPPSRRGMTVSATMVVALFFGFVISYMILRASDVFSPNVDIHTLRLGYGIMQQSMPGIIVRHEHVFQADRDGRVVFDAGENERVSAGTRVASIRDIEAVTHTEQEMAWVEQQLIDMAGRRNTAPDPQIDRLNTNLRNAMDRNMTNHMQKNLSDIYSLLDNLTQITENRNTMVINEVLHLNNDLNNRHDLLAAQRGRSLSDIYATHTGNMSMMLDGYEAYFIPRMVYYINREDIQRPVEHETINPGREVVAGDDIFKIVENTWYVAVWLPGAMAQGFAERDTRVIYLENVTTGRFQPMPMVVHHINSLLGRYTFVVFRSNRNVNDFLHQRNVNVRITDSVQAGFTVPTSAIATRRFFRIPLTHIHGYENYSVRHRLDDNTNRDIPVQIYRRTDTHAYILEDFLPLVPGDPIVPVNAYLTHHVISYTDIELVRGVYNVNLNVAEFRQVDIGGEILDETTTSLLLDPVRNPDLRQFDSIVRDAGLVRQGQVVR